jgi:hypothetical protein
MVSLRFLPFHYSLTILTAALSRTIGTESFSTKLTTSKIVNRIPRKPLSLFVLTSAGAYLVCSHAFTRHGIKLTRGFFLCIIRYSASKPCRRALLAHSFRRSRSFRFLLLQTLRLQVTSLALYERSLYCKPSRRSPSTDCSKADFIHLVRDTGVWSLCDAARLLVEPRSP